MKRDTIATGEALPDGGVDVTPLIGARQTGLSPEADAVLREIETRAFRHYQRAFAANEVAPTLHAAASLVRAWNAYADLMGIERV